MKVGFSIALCASFAEGARVQVHEQDQLAWGRSCESLESRFTQQGARLAELEGSRALVASVSLMRTLRRANARDCAWVENNDVDTSGLSTLASSYIQQSPCYEPARAAFQTASELPEEERDDATLNAMALLFSNNEDCSADGGVPAELAGESEEALEEELDDETDDIMEQLASTPQSSLIQVESQPPLCVGVLSCVLLGTLGSWSLALQSLPILIGVILFTILTALFCGAIMHALVRIFRWIRCNISGNSCEEYAPATWLRVVVRGTCGVAGLVLGPWSGIFTLTGISTLAGAVR